MKSQATDKAKPIVRSRREPMSTNEYDAIVVGARCAGWGVIPTHDDLTLVIIGWPYAEFDGNRKDVEGTYLGALDLVPEFAAQFQASFDSHSAPAGRSSATPATPRTR
jgi:hypothetical protein